MLLNPLTRPHRCREHVQFSAVQWVVVLAEFTVNI